MANSIDNRIVEMRFDNAQFERGVNTTIMSLADLNKGLKLEGATKGLLGVSAAAKSFSLEGLMNGIENVTSKFSIFGAIGFSVIQDLTKRFISLSATMLSAITGPLIEGGKRRALTIEQAKFQFKGLGMDIDATMKSALDAVKGTSFGLDEAAKAAAMFGASGMRAGIEMTTALKGIAGVAAMSGSSFADVADVFTKVAGQGRLMGMDLQRLASRGINAAATLAKSMGKTEAEVREMVTKGKISFKMFSDAMSDAFGEHATKASETFAGALANMKAAMSRIGAQYFTYQFEAMRLAINPLTKVIDQVAGALGPFITLLGNNLISVAGKAAVSLEELAANGFTNMYAAIEPMMAAIKNLSSAVKQFVTPIGEAFRSAFPPTSKTILDYVEAFRSFTRFLLPSAEAAKTYKGAVVDMFIGIKRILNGVSKTFGAIKEAFMSMIPPSASGLFADFAENFKTLSRLFIPTAGYLETVTTVFKGLFSIVSLGGKVFKFLVDAVVAVIDTLFISSGHVSTFGDALKWVITGISEFFIALNESADSSNVFAKTLEHIRDALQWVVEKLAPLKDGIKSFIDSLKPIKTDLDPIAEKAASFGERVAKAFDIILAIMNEVKIATQPLRSAFFALFDGLEIGNVVASFGALLTGIGIFKMGKFGDNLLSPVKDFGDIFKSISGMFNGFSANVTKIFDGLTGALKGMQNQLNAKALKDIAIAIAILAGSMLVISLINPDRLAGALTGMVLLIAEVMAMLATMNKMDGGMKGVIAGAVAMGILAIAILLLAVAVKSMGNLDIDVLAKGLGAVGLLLGALGLFAKYVDTDKSLIAAGAGMILFGVAMIIFSKALRTIGAMDQGELVQALVAIGALFAFVLGINKLMKPSELAKTAFGLVILAGAMIIMGIALRTIGDLSVEELATGLVGMAIGLGILLGAMQLLPDDVVAKALGMAILAGATYLLGMALQKIADIGVEGLVASTIGLAVILGVIAGFLSLVKDPSMLVGVAALLLISVALVIFGTALAIIGALPAKNIAIGLGVLAGALIVIAVAGMLLEAAAPGLLAFGATVLMIGAAVFFAAVGLALFVVGIGLMALGIGILVSALVAGGAALVTTVLVFAEAMPAMATQVAKALGAFATEIINQQTAVTGALVALFTGLLDALITLMPKILEFVSVAITGILELLMEKTPEIAEAALLMLIALLEKIEENLPRLIEIGGDTVVAYIKGLTKYNDKVIKAGADFIIGLIRGIGREMERIADEAMKVVIKFVDGLTSAINKNGAKFDTSAKNLLKAIFDRVVALLLPGGTYDFAKVGENIAAGFRRGIEGILTGLRNLGERMVDAVSTGSTSRAIIKSPSRLFAGIGVRIVEGLIVGIEGMLGAASDSGEAMVVSAYTAMQAAADGAVNIFDSIEPPTITPVVDLDEVYAGAKAIADIMGDTPAMQVAGTVGSRFVKPVEVVATATDVATGDTTFNQYNYSPKALSRLEIHRQTRNQLHQLKGLGAV